MNAAIEAMVKSGKKKIEKDQQEQMRVESIRIEALRKSWGALVSQWREALPEVVREYMEVLSEDEVSNFCDHDPSKITKQDLLIIIPGFAPIKTWVGKSYDETWKQINAGQYGHMLNYVVPGVFDDPDAYEDGVYWNWEAGVRATDDLDVALAWAREQYESWINFPSSQKTNQDMTELSYESVDETILNNEYQEDAYREIARTFVEKYMKCL